MKIRNITTDPWFVGQPGALVKVDPGGVADFPADQALELVAQMDGTRFALADKAPTEKKV